MFTDKSIPNGVQLLYSVAPNQIYESYVTTKDFVPMNTLPKQEFVPSTIPKLDIFHSFDELLTTTQVPSAIDLPPEIGESS